MPQPYTDTDIDNMLSNQDNTLEGSDYDDDDLDLDDDLDGEGNPIRATPAGAESANTPDLSRFLADDLKWRQEEAQRRAAEQQQAQQRQYQEQQAQSAQQRQQAIDARLDGLFAKDEIPDLTEEQRKVYGDSQPIIEQLARREIQKSMSGMRGAFKDLLVQNADLEDRIAQAQKAAEVSPQQQLDLAVMAQVPNVNEILSRSDWAAYRSKPIPGVGMTPGDIIQGHYQRGNAAGVVEVLRNYESQRKTQRQETVAPSGRATSGPDPRQSGQRMLRLSSLNAAYQKRNQGLMSQDKLQSIVDRFEDAAARGLVNYNE